MTEASEFMIGDVVLPLTQLIHDQADIRHGKELILGAMDDVDRQVQDVQLELVVFDATLTHLSYVSLRSALSDSRGSGSEAVLLPSGFPMKAGTRLCFGLGNHSGVVFVHGFFAKDK